MKLDGTIYNFEIIMETVTKALENQKVKKYITASLNLFIIII